MTAFCLLGPGLITMESEMKKMILPEQNKCKGDRQTIGNRVVRPARSISTMWLVQEYSVEAPNSYGREGSMKTS